MGKDNLNRKLAIKCFLLLKDLACVVFLERNQDWYQDLYN